MTPTFYQKRTHYRAKEKMSDLENHVRHVIGVEETPDSVIIEYAKAHDDEEMDMEENAHYDEDEEEDRGIDATFYRSVSLRKDDKDKTRFNVAFVSEEPVLREFGYEIIDQERMDTTFLNPVALPCFSCMTRSEFLELWKASNATAT